MKVMHSTIDDAHVSTRFNTKHSVSDELSLEDSVGQQITDGDGVLTISFHVVKNMCDDNYLPVVLIVQRLSHHTRTVFTYYLAGHAHVR